MRRNQQTKAPRMATGSYFRRSKWMMLALAGVVGIAGFAAFHSSRPRAGNEVEASPHPMGTAEVTAFFPTIPNKIVPPAPAPNGTVWIPGGEFSMGAMDPPAVSEIGMHGAADARPIHRVYVDGFWMDKTDVTNGEFARFVTATKYVTIAERKPTAEEFPRCATRESGGRLCCLLTPGSPCTTE